MPDYLPAYRRRARPACWRSSGCPRSTSSSRWSPRRCGSARASSWPTASREPDVLAAMEAFARAQPGPLRPAGLLRRRRRLRPRGPAGHACPGRRSEFVTSYTPVPARGGPGRPAGRLRVPDHGGPAGRAAGGQRLPLRRRQRRSSRRSTWAWPPRAGPDGVALGGDPPALAPVLATCAAGHRASLVTVPAGGRAHRLARRCRRSRPAGRGRWSAIPTTWAASRTCGRPGGLCDRTGALLVVAADPVAAGLLTSAGEWGADVVVGEGQAFGTALGFGGPYLGLFACAAAHVRRLPGPAGGRDGRRRGAPRPTSPPCAPVNRTSGGRRPPPTSAPTRP